MTNQQGIIQTCKEKRKAIPLLSNISLLLRNGEKIIQVLQLCLLFSTKPIENKILKANLESKNGDPPELTTLWESHTIHFSHNSTTLEVGPDIILTGVKWNTTNINLLCVFFTVSRTKLKLPRTYSSEIKPLR